MPFDERTSTTKTTLNHGEFERYFPNWATRIFTLQDIVDPKWKPLSLEHQIFLIALFTQYKGAEDVLDLIMEKERRGMNTLLVQEDSRYRQRIFDALVKIPEFTYLFKNEKGFQEIFTPLQQMLILFAYLKEILPKKLQFSH